MKRKGRLLALLLAFSITLCGIWGDGNATVKAVDETKRVYEEEGYRVTVTEQSSWEDGAVAEIKIENTGEEQIRNWQLEAEFLAGEMVNVWNAEEEKTEKGYTFACEEYNRVLQSGESITMGYQIQGGSIAELQGIKLVQKKTSQTGKEDYSVSYRVVNTWDKNATIEVEIQNQTDALMEDWQICFDYAAEIYNIWNAQIVEKEDGKYSIKNMDYNASIQSNGTVTFGFQAKFSDGEIGCPENAILKTAGQKTEAAEADEDDFDPEEDVYVYHDIENQAWNLEMINADADIVQESLKKTEGKIRVALLDSGVNYSEEVQVSLRKNFIPGEEEVTELYEDASGHGTAIAEVLASDPKGISEDGQSDEEDVTCFDGDEELELIKGDTSDTAEDTEDDEGTLSELLDSGYEWNQGVNPMVDLISAKVLDDNNETTVGRVVEAIDWAIENEADIISMSFGMEKGSKKLHQAIRKASDAGILLVASVGDGETAQYPAAYQEVMAVGAVDSLAQQSGQSAGGEEAEVVAPGEFIVSRGAFDSMQIFSGTSMAVPHVVGLASILWQKDTSQSPEFIRSLIDATARECGGSACGYGVIDCEQALKQYDEFRTIYQEKGDETDTDEIAGEIDSSEEIDTDEDVRALYANWQIGVHVGFVTKYTKKSKEKWSSVGDVLDVLSYAVKYPDKSASCKGMRLNPWFHGYFGEKGKKDGKDTVQSNYVASAYYLYTLAQNMYREGKLQKTDTTGDAFQEKASECIQNAYKGINKKIKDSGVGGVSWEELFSKASVNIKIDRKSKSIFLFGMMLHTLTDTYAHSTYVWDETKKTKIVWKLLKHKNKTSDGAYMADSTKAYRQRYTAAKAAANQLMSCIKVSKDKGFTGFCKAEKMMKVYTKADYYDIDAASRNFSKEDSDKKGKMKVSFLKKAYALKRSGQYAKEMEKFDKIDSKVMKKVKERLIKVSYTHVSEITKKYTFISITNDFRSNLIKENYSASLYDMQTRKLLENVSSTSGNYAFAIAKDRTYCFVTRSANRKKRYTCYIMDGKLYNENGVKIQNQSEKTEDTDDSEEEQSVELCESSNSSYELQSTACRIELTWKDKSVDLDSLLTAIFPNEENTSFYMTYFLEKTAHPELGDVFQKDERAAIVKDVKMAGEAEVTHIYYLDEDAYYYFSVRNYTENSDTELSASGATVKVYRGDSSEPAYVYQVPEGKGYYWMPFGIIGATGTIQTANTITYEALGYEP